MNCKIIKIIFLLAVLNFLISCGEEGGGEKVRGKRNAIRGKRNIKTTKRAEIERIVFEGERLLQAKRYAKAKEKFDKALTLDPADKSLVRKIEKLKLKCLSGDKFAKLYSKGINALQKKDWQTAVISFERAFEFSKTLDVKTKLEKAKYQLSLTNGEKAVKRKDWKDAIFHYNNALRIKDNEEIRKKLRDAKIKNRETELTEKRRKEKFEKFFKAGKEYEKRKKWDLALPAYYTALKYTKRKSIVRERISYCQKMNEKKRLAKFSKLVTKAKSFIKKGEWKEAIQILKNALRLNPEDRKIKKLLTKIKRNLFIKDMVFVPAGEFIMGSDTGETDERPQRKVRVKAFFIDKCEVSNRQYKKFTDATGHPRPKYWKNGTYPKGMGDYPVEGVSWFDAKAYAKWVGKRLPTEVEWERAARGKKGLVYPWGNVFIREKCNSWESDSSGLSPVGKLKEGESPTGCFNMAGNVWEWVEDWYSYKDDESKKTHKILKGGGWSSKKEALRCSNRLAEDPYLRMRATGFRCAVSAD